MSRWHTLKPENIYGGRKWAALLAQAGCYCLYHNGEAVYVGQTKHLYTRLKKHYNAYRMIEGGWRIKIRPERVTGERTLLEQRLIARLRPANNGPESVGVMAVLGGKARARALSPRRRREIARKAANARWNAVSPS